MSPPHPVRPWLQRAPMALVLALGLGGQPAAQASAAHDAAAHDAARRAAVEDARAGRLEPALHTLRQLAQSAADVRVHHDLIVVLGWAGHHEQALQAWATLGWRADLPDYVRHGLAHSLRALAEQAESSGHTLLALRYRGQGMAAPIQDPLAREAVGRLLGTLGGHRGAAWLLPTTTLQQRADRIALELRTAASLSAQAAAERTRRLDAVIRDLSDLAAELQQDPAAPARLVRQVHGDRAIAQVERRQWALALQDVQALQALGAPLPPHVRMAQGAALLGLQRPAEAVSVYEAVLAEQAQHVPAQWGLFYAWADQGEMRAAQAVMDRTAVDRWRRVGLDARTEPHPDWLPARLASARVRMWNEDQAGAWTQLAALRQAAPDNAGVRLAQAAAAASRGWPRLAEQETQAAHTLDENSPDVRLALAESALRRQRWALLRDHLKPQGEAGGSDEQGLAWSRLRHDAALAMGWQWAAAHQVRLEPSRVGLSPGESRLTNTRLESPLLGSGWRAFWTAEAIQGLSPGVYAARRELLGMGLKFEGPNNRWEAVALQDSGSRPGTAWSAGARHTLDDHWAVEWVAARRSTQAPLRAWANGIEVDSAEIRLDHSWHEGRASSVAGMLQRFSDGNERRGATAALMQRLRASAQWQLYLRPELAYTQNSQDQGPYYSPRREAALSLSLISRRTWLSTPQRRWSDRLELQAGRQQQLGYAPHTIAALAYEHTISASAGLDFTAGLTGSLRYYDGQPQRAWVGFARMAARF